MTQRTVQASASEVIKMLRAADRELTAAVTSVVRDVAKHGRDIAVRKAEEQGFAAPGRSGRGTGALMRNLSYSTRGATALIRETANRDGYRYPAVFEFSKHSRWQARPFLLPAAEELAPEAEALIAAAVEAALARLEATT